MKAPVKIAGYNPKWPVIYAREKDLILSVIGGKAVGVEHVGSTAVPGLGAKPIIDVMVGVQELSAARDCIEPLKSVGYEYVPEYEKTISERRYFRKGPEGIPNKHFHLHMVEVDGNFWKRHLLFRDFLRCHPDVARKYHRLRARMYVQADLSSYTRVTLDCRFDRSKCEIESDLYPALWM